VKRPSNSVGDGGADARKAAVSAGPPRGPSVIQFPSPAAKSAGAREGAGVSSASASSTFTSLGDLTHAVVLRLAGGYPRIRVERAAEEALAARSGDQPAAWEDEERR